MTQQLDETAPLPTGGAVVIVWAMVAVALVGIAVAAWAFRDSIFGPPPKSNLLPKSPGELIDLPVAEVETLSNAHRLSVCTHIVCIDIVGHGSYRIAKSPPRRHDSLTRMARGDFAVFEDRGRTSAQAVSDRGGSTVLEERPNEAAHHGDRSVSGRSA